MEQITQQIAQKPPFPIKTKIAAWWMIIGGGIIIIYSVWFVIEELQYFPFGGAAIGLFVILPLGLLPLFLPGLPLLKRKKWGWYWAIIALFITIAMFTYGFIGEIDCYYGIFGRRSHCYDPMTGKLYGIYEERDINYLLPIIVGITITLTPFIFLLLDRKNFWKITT